MFVSLLVLALGLASTADQDPVAASTGIREPVPANAPDTLPAWVYADTNIAAPSAFVPGSFARNIVIVLFRRSATPAERQVAVERVRGRVVGGYAGFTGNGEYYLRVEDPGDASVLLAAADILETFPWVLGAHLGVFGAGPNKAQPTGDERESTIRAPTPAEAPDTIPAWVYADSNVAQGSSFVSGRFVRSIVAVRFLPGISVADRNAILARIDGTVIGGRRIAGAEGFYLVRVSDTGTGETLVKASRLLNSLPQVISASLEVYVTREVTAPSDASQLPVRRP